MSSSEEGMFSADKRRNQVSLNMPGRGVSLKKIKQFLKIAAVCVKWVYVENSTDSHLHTQPTVPVCFGLNTTALLNGMLNALQLGENTRTENYNKQCQKKQIRSE